MTEADKRFLISLEQGKPEWNDYEFEYFKNFPSVKWKLVNLAKLAKHNPKKLIEEAAKLETLFLWNDISFINVMPIWILISAQPLNNMTAEAAPIW